MRISDLALKVRGRTRTSGSTTPSSDARRSNMTGKIRKVGLTGTLLVLVFAAGEQQEIVWAQQPKGVAPKSIQPPPLQPQPLQPQSAQPLSGQRQGLPQ